MADLDSPAVFQSNLTHMLNGCPYLESLQLNIRGILVDATAFQSVRFSLPETLKLLRLQPLLESEAILLINRFKVTGTYISQADYSSLLSPSPSFTLQSLSLVLDLISDRLIVAITGSLPQLVRLDLEDRPEIEPFPDNDLTYTGLQSLGYCQQLTSLSLVRTCYNRKISFKRINDMGIFLLSEACKGLESVRLGGFPKVSDAGFASLLHSCRNLKIFEVRGAFLLSDLAFHDVTGSSCSLQEVRLSTCPLITSEAVKKLGLCGNLEVLDLGSCKSISDSCLNSVSALRKLTSLNLAGADVTDSGMLALSKSDVPITQLSLRGCKRVSDRGISYLLNNEGTISKTLSTLDLGHMPGISDRSIHTITRYCKALTELSKFVSMSKTAEEETSLNTKSGLTVDKVWKSQNIEAVTHNWKFLSHRRIVKTSGCFFCNKSGHRREVCFRFKNQIRMLWNMKKCHLEPSRFCHVWIAKRDLYGKSEKWLEELKYKRMYDITEAVDL